jgi:hypothetical protein
MTRKADDKVLVERKTLEWLLELAKTTKFEYEGMLSREHIAEYNRVIASAQEALR